jgi:membrane peptidoglycan carboxypeptidase
VGVLLPTGRRAARQFFLDLALPLAVAAAERIAALGWLASTRAFAGLTWIRRRARLAGRRVREEARTLPPRARSAALAIGPAIDRWGEHAALPAARRLDERVAMIARALRRAAIIVWRAARARRPRTLPRVRLWMLLVAIAIVGAWVGASSVLAALPDPAQLETAEVPYSTFVYDRDGRLLYTFEEEHREHASLEEVPLVLRQATIAIEDRSFWTNFGVDPGGIFRAFVTNWREGRVAQGGSTITQQLVKARLTGDDQTLERKLNEALIAIRVTMRYSKAQILEMYLDQVYYGNRSYGVKTAAKTYFGVTDLRQLSLGQSALLAGLPQRPSVYDPVTNPEGARERRSEVLAAMLSAGFITREMAETAANEPILVHAADTPLSLPHVVFRIRDQLAAVFGSERAAYVGGYRVYTTIDPTLQAIAERQVRDRVAALGSSNVRNAALISLDPRDGHILAYVGSVNYEDQSPRVRGQFDVAGLGERQVGSTFKLFTYLTALRLGLTPSSVLWDVSTNFAPAGQPAYRPQNASPSGYGAGPENGPITIRQAIRESLNVPAVKIASLVGVSEIVQTARMLGVERNWSDSQLGLSFGIGAAEMTLRELAGAYQVVANGGVRIEPTLISRIEDRDGNVVRDWSHPEGVRAISPQLAWLMTDILKDTTDPNASSIFGSWTNLGRTAALKTGTTDNLRDVLAVGYVPRLLTAVWMGNSDNSQMSGISSAMGPGVLWREYMKESLDKLQVPVEWYARPDGIVEKTVCVRTGLNGGVGSGLLPGPNCPSSWRTVEKYVAGTEPKTDDSAFFGRGCVNASAERPEWLSDVQKWAQAFKNYRLGIPICGVAVRPAPTPQPQQPPRRRRGG